jgi:sugar/nucleoside kinase (ribokinase family)
MPFPDVIGLGEVVIDLIAPIPHYPELDEKIFATGYERHPGGVTANFCVALSRLGVNAGFVGGVGDDSDAGFLRNVFKRRGVDISHLATRQDCPTPMNFVMVTPDGQKIIVQSPYMLTTFPRPEELDLDYIASAKVLHTTALRIDTAKKALRHAKKSGVTTSFDLEKHVATHGYDKLASLLKFTDILLPNKMGALTITRAKDLKEAAEKLMSFGPGLVVITQGDSGCLVKTPEEILEVPAFKVDGVDTTGAGDAFNAGFIMGILKEWDVSLAAKFANAVAAMKITHVGAQSGLPTFKEVKNFLKERE